MIPFHDVVDTVVCFSSGCVASKSGDLGDRDLNINNKSIDEAGKILFNIQDMEL